MNIDLSGRTALVSGSTAGIGAAVAEALDTAGAEVVLNGRNAERVAETARRLGARDVAADVGTPEGRDALIPQIPEADILVNNSGIFAAQPVFEIPDGEGLRFKGMPMAEEQGVSMVVGGPCSSGILAGGSHFEYAEAPQAIIDRVKRIKEIADRNGVSIKAAALQFSLAHPVSAAVIPGATRPSCISEDLSARGEQIPDSFWRELREAKLVSAKAPLPNGI